MNRLRKEKAHKMPYFFETKRNVVDNSPSTEIRKKRYY
jgi:hypothetical protein